MSAPQPAETPTGARRPLLLAEWRWLALIVLLFLLCDLPWRLEELGQAAQASASLEMVQAGHWWFQHLPGGRQASTVPPLAGWLAAGAYYLTGGNWDLAWRLPSLAAALALAVLLWRAGERLWPRWGGTLAAGAFALNFLTPGLAAQVGTALPLTLWTTWIGLLIWSRVRTSQPWNKGARWAVFCLLVAALLTQGLVVYAILLPGLLAYRWISRRVGTPPAADAWGGWWHWALPLLPFLFWLERGCILVPGFYQEITGHPAAGQAAPYPDEPIYFYALTLLTHWLPWTVLFLAARVRVRQVWWQLCREPGNLWLICWAAGGLLGLTLAPARHLGLLLPVLPPLCLWLTATLASAPAAPWALAWSRRTLWLSAALAVAFGVAQISLVYRRHDNADAAFASQVLTQPARCELVLTKAPGPDDARMLVYLRRTVYLDPAQAIQLNSTGKLDRIVLHSAALESSRGLLTRFDTAHPVLVSAFGGKYALLSSHAGAPPATHR